MRFLVTGGCGFIGRHLVNSLVSLGKRVVVLDNRPVAFGSGPGSAVDLIEGSISDDHDVERALDGCCGVFHLAAISSITECELSPDQCLAVNARSTRKLFDAIKRMGPIPVVYASSAAVYGDTKGHSASETTEACPDTRYGRSKLEMERLAKHAGDEFGIPNIGLRFFNVFGTDTLNRADKGGVIPRFVAQAMSDKVVTVYGDGRQRRDFVFITDAVDHLLAAMNNTLCSSLVLNVCTGIGTSVESLTANIRELTGRKIRVEYLPDRQFDIRHSIGNEAQASAILGVHCTISLGEGIAALLRNY
jgi:UDP-glucose 4-epimerase